jgi:Zn-dependent peptidase ImmA (M78 family)
MPEGITIKPDVLIWARLSLGLSREEAAALLNVTTEDLASWETSEQSFGISQLRRFAAKYKRPEAAFLRSSTPTLPAGPEDFRTVGGIEPRLDVDTLVTIRDAQRLSSVATELREDAPALFSEPTFYEADYQHDSPVEMAFMERERLGISMENQLKSGAVNRIYNAWKIAVQNQGILVFVKSMDRGVCRGFSLFQEGNVPVIVINQKEVDQAKIFTLFHEYAHLMIRRQGLCLEREDVDKRTVERWCNEFAASLLVPQDRLSRLAPRSGITIQNVESLATRFKVSRPVIALSLIRLGRATEDLYFDLKRQSEDVDWSVIIPSNEDDFPMRAQDQIRLAELGVGYTNLVLNALDRRIISSIEACDYLDMRADKLPDLKRRVGETIARYK